MEVQAQPARLTQPDAVAIRLTTGRITSPPRWSARCGTPPLPPSQRAVRHFRRTPLIELEPDTVQFLGRGRCGLGPLLRPGPRPADRRTPVCVGQDAQSRCPLAVILRPHGYVVRRQDRNIPTEQAYLVPPGRFPSLFAGRWEAALLHPQPWRELATRPGLDHPIILGHWHHPKS